MGRGTHSCKPYETLDRVIMEIETSPLGLSYCSLQNQLDKALTFRDEKIFDLLIISGVFAAVIIISSANTER